MKISEYIQLLEEQKKIHGDIMVQVQHHDAIYTPEIVGVMNTVWVWGKNMTKELVETLEPYLLVR